MSDSTVNGSRFGAESPEDALRELLVRLEGEPRARWLVLLRADQHDRWERGQRLPAEVYLDRLTSLCLDDDTAVDLIYSEAQLRLDRGEQPGPEEYSRRFPRYADALRKQFDLLAALRASPDLWPNGSGDPTQEVPRQPRPSTDTLRIAAAGVDNSTLDHPVFHCDDALASPLGYEILEELGRGGMGVVYLAWQKGLDRFVALKMIRDDDLADPQVRARFRREAATAARLSHPNIVQVFEVGEWRAGGANSSVPYFSLEFCDGGSLAQAGQPWAPRAAAEMIETLARAVEYAHSQGVVHRDLKPANILLAGTRDEARGAKSDGSTLVPRLSSLVPKIADFGLARQLEAAGHSRSQAITGTPGYMAPEQATGRPATSATDVHALGTILYEMLSGRPPYQGLNVLETLEQVRFADPPSLASLNPHVHRDLETICLKCLQKDPRARYGTALSLAEDLRRFLNNEPIHARPVGAAERGWRWCRRNPGRAVLSTLCVVALLGLLVGEIVHTIRLAEANDRAAVAQQTADLEESARRAAEREEAGQRYFSLLHNVREKQATRLPGWTWAGIDRLRAACAIDTGVRNVVHLRTEAAALLSGTDLREQTVLTKDFCAAASALHPDGNLLAVGQLKAQGYVASAVRLIDRSGKLPPLNLVVLADPNWSRTNRVQDGIRAVAFSRDGRWLLAGTRSGWVCRWDLKRLDVPPFSWRAHDCAIEDICPTPAGAVTSTRMGHMARSWDLAGAPRLTGTYTAPPPRLFDMKASPDGKLLVCAREGGLDLLRPDDLQPAGPSLPVNGMILAFSPDGAVLATEEEGRIVLVDVVSRRVARTLRDPDLATSHEASLTDIVFSPDGALMATGCDSQDDRKLKLWDVASGQMVASRLVHGKGPLCPVFTADGRGLIVGSESRVLQLDIGGRDVRLTRASHPFPLTAMGCSPYGRRVACVSEQPDGPGQRGAVTLWNLEHDTLLAQRQFDLPRGDSCPAAVALTDGRVAWSASGGRGFLWDPEGGVPERMLHESPAGLMAWTADGTRLWNAAGPRVQARQGHDLSPVSKWCNVSTEGLPQLYSLSVGRRWVLAGGRDGHASLLRQGDGTLEKCLPGPGGALSAAALSPDETLAVVGTHRGLLRVLSVPGGETVIDLTEHTDAVEGLAFDGTGQLLATGGRDHRIRLWRREGTDFHLLLALRTSGPVKSLWLNADGSRLVVLGHRESAVRVWRLDRLRQECKKLGIGW